jgi:hypothetical protein
MQLVMRLWRRKTIVVDAESVLWEFAVWYFRLVFFLLRSQLGKLPPAPDFRYSFGFS